MRARDFINEKRRKKKRNPATVLYYGYPWGWTGDSSGDSGDGGGMSESSHDAVWTDAVNRHTRMRALAKRQGDEEKFNYHHNELRKLFGKEMPVTPDSTFNDDPGGIKIDEIGVPPVSPSWPMPDKLPRKQPPFPDPKKKISEELTPESAQELWIKNYGKEMAERVFYNIKNELLHTVSDLKSIRASACDTQDRLEAMSRVEFARWLLTYFTDALERYDWPEAHSEGITQVIRDKVRQPLLNKQCLLENSADGANELYHGTLVKNVPSILANGLNPTVGEFTKSIYKTKAKPLVFAADLKGSRAVYCALASQIGMLLNKFPPSAREIAQHGAILVISKDVGKFKQYTSNRRQGSKEPTDYTSQETISIDRVIKGQDLVQWIKTHNADRGEMACPVSENFADGKKPGRKGLAKRMGVPTKASVSRLRQIAKSSSGEKARMAHFVANMKSGRNK